MQLHPLVLIWVSLYFHCLSVDLHCPGRFLLIIEHIMHVAVDEACLAYARIAYNNELPIEVWTVLVVNLGFERFCVIHYNYINLS